MPSRTKLDTRGLRLRKGRYYGDARIYYKLGIVPTEEVKLVPEGGLSSTTDIQAAAEIYAKLKEDWEETAKLIDAGKRPNLRRDPSSYVQQYVDHMLAVDPEHRKSPSAIAQTARYLQRLLEETSFGALTDIRQVDYAFCSELFKELLALPPLRRIPRTRTRALSYAVPVDGDPEMGERLSSGTRKAIAMALSALITYAKSRGDFLLENPVASHKELPTGKPEEPARWFEAAEVAAMLERLFQRRTRHHKNPYAPEVIASLFYTGGRKSEVFALAPESFDLDRDIILMDNSKQHKMSKGRAPKLRETPLWPAYRAIIVEFAEREGITLGVVNPGRPLMFPGSAQLTGDVQEMQTIVQTLRTLAKAVGVVDWESVYEHMTRHTHVAARLTMMEAAVGGQWVPTSLWQISQEIGNSVQVLESTYAHAMKRPLLRASELDYAALANAERGGFRGPGRGGR